MESKVPVSIPPDLMNELKSASKAILSTLDEAIVPRREKMVRFTPDTPRDHDSDPPHRSLNGKRQRTVVVEEISAEELATIPVISRGKTIHAHGRPVDPPMDPEVFFKNLLENGVFRHNQLEERNRTSRGSSSSSAECTAPQGASASSDALPPLEASSDAPPPMGASSDAPPPMGASPDAPPASSRMYAPSSEPYIAPPTSGDLDGMNDFSLFNDDI